MHENKGTVPGLCFTISGVWWMGNQQSSNRVHESSAKSARYQHYCIIHLSNTYHQWMNNGIPSALLLWIMSLMTATDCRVENLCAQFLVWYGTVSVIVIRFCATNSRSSSTLESRPRSESNWVKWIRNNQQREVRFYQKHGTNTPTLWPRLRRLPSAVVTYQAALR